MEAILILLVIVGIIAGLLWMVRGKQSPTRRRMTNLNKYDSDSACEDANAQLGGLDKLRNNSLFWGLEMGQPGCEAAQAILGKQFTFDEAPQLPLDGCSSAMCTCQFKGLKNRRAQHRRTSSEERRVEVRFEKDKPDRRSRKDRRRSDKGDDHTL